MAKKQYPSIYDEHFQRQAFVFFDDVAINGQPFDWRWIKAQGLAESGLNPKSVSPVGAKGIMQLMPATSAEISAALHLPDEMFDPLLNIKFGAYYDRRMWMMWRMERGMERLRFMFGAYNAGAGNILKAQQLASPTDQWWAVAKALPRVTGIGNARETVNYVKRIEAYHQELCEENQ